MRMQKTHRTFLIIVLSILVVGLLPGVAMVWAETESGLAGISLESGSFSPPAQGEGPVVRPTPYLDDMIVQFGTDSEDISVQSDGSGVEIVPAAAFVHTGELGTGTEAEDWFFFGGGGYVRNDSANQVCLAAPVHLPPGNVITSFTVYVYDNSPSNVTVYLDRTASWDFDWDELASVESVGSVDDVQILTDPSITDGLIPPEFNYHVDFCLPANSGFDLRVKAAQITYAVSNQDVYLPIVLKQEVQIPMTNLSVTNSTGGTVIYYRLRDLGTNAIVAECPDNFTNGTTVSCPPAFPSGEYKVEGSFALCGSGSTNITFPQGNCTRTVTCPSEGGPPPSMVCN